MAGRDKLIGGIEWKGDEYILDVGCGRGLILVGAALKLRTGAAVGIDMWQAQDLSGNRLDLQVSLMLCAIVTMGLLRPNTMLARKAV